MKYLTSIYFTFLFAALCTVIMPSQTMAQDNPFNDPAYQASLDEFNGLVQSIEKGDIFGSPEYSKEEYRQNKQLAADLTYLKPVVSDEIERFFGYQADGFLSGTEWKVTQNNGQASIPVIASVAGEIRTITDTTELGTVVNILHVPGTETILAHLDTVSVAPGTIVSPGQVIGFINTDEFNTLYHEIRIDNTPIDPAEAVGLDFFDIKRILLKGAQRALQKEARIEGFIINNDNSQLSFANTFTETSGDGTSPNLNGEAGTTPSTGEAQLPAICQNPAPPGCEQPVLDAICDSRQATVDKNTAAFQEAYRPKQSVFDSICAEQLIANFVNFNNIFVGTNPKASQQQVTRVADQLVILLEYHKENIFDPSSGAGILVGLRDFAQASLDTIIGNINNFITGTIAAFTSAIFGPLADLASEYNCQGIAALWYTAENCFGLDVGGFLDAITIDRIELPHFGCVVETLASSFNPNAYQDIAAQEAQYGTRRRSEARFE